MAVKIRLSRIGKKNAPFYRIVAIDERKKRDGASLEILGTYNPRSGQFVQFHEARIQHWIGLGAQETDPHAPVKSRFRFILGGRGQLGDMKGGNLAVGGYDRGVVAVKYL